MSCKIPDDFVAVCTSAATNFNALSNKYNDQATKAYNDITNAYSACITTVGNETPNYADAQQYVKANYMCPLTCNFPADGSKPSGTLTPDCQKCWDTNELVLSVKNKCNQTCGMNNPETKAIMQMYIDYAYNGGTMAKGPDYKASCEAKASSGNCTILNAFYNVYKPWSQVDCSGWGGCTSTDNFLKCAREQYCTTQQAVLSDDMKKWCSLK